MEIILIKSKKCLKNIFHYFIVELKVEIIMNQCDYLGYF